MEICIWSRWGLHLRAFPFLVCFYFLFIYCKLFLRFFWGLVSLKNIFFDYLFMLSWYPRFILYSSVYWSFLVLILLPDYAKVFNQLMFIIPWKSKHENFEICFRFGNERYKVDWLSKNYLFLVLKLILRISSTKFRDLFS
jgi:hypothetical protein